MSSPTDVVATLPATMSRTHPGVRADLGQRVALRRRQHGLSRRVVANLVGRSEEWLRQVERGQRRLDSIEVLLHLARVLHIDDLGDFLGWDGATMAAPRASSLTAKMHDVLLDSPLPGSFPASVHAAPLPLSQLATELSQAWNTWRTSPERHARLTAVLPRLLPRLRSAWRAGERTPELVTLLVRALGLARYHAHSLGDEHLAWIAAEHCLAVAMKSTSLLEQGAAIVHRAACMRALQYAERARSLAVEAADCMREPEHLPVRGALLLQAAEAAADVNQRHEADRLLDLARVSAAELGSDSTTEFILFGPLEVGIREVRIAMRMGRYDSALRLARELSLPPDLPIDRRVGHLITMAYGYTQVRDDVAAVFALNRAAELSTEDLRLNQFARLAIQRLAHRGHLLIADDISRLSAIAFVS
jgi:transcriptional regulator with XRE-family HTH domain